MKIYISGSITDGGTITDPAESKRREQLFHEAEASLTSVGYDVINPAREEGRENCSSWVDYMRASLRDIAEADALALLPGWTNSRGARIENRLAFDLGLPRYAPHVWLHPDNVARFVA